MSVPLPHAAISGADSGFVATRATNLLASLDHLGILHFSGEDAESFLQGQLSCDVGSIQSSRSTHGAYCSPKGRMLANFLLWREEAGFAMALSRDILGAVHRRISMFVLRSRVKISDASGSVVLLGIAGPGADGALRGILGGLPGRSGEIFRAPGLGTAIRLVDGRLILASVPPVAASLRQQLAGTFRDVGSQVWRWLDIRSGLPLITAPTQDQLVPQMANLELLDGVSFDKGCYTGQEIVARTQHLGKVKRRMFIANVAAAAGAGDPLYSEDLGDQASGLVVNAEPSPDGGHDVLAVVQTASHDRSVVHLKSLSGPVLHFHALPYAIM